MPIKLEAYKKTSHGMMAESGMEQAPKCADCHTAHYIRKIDDPQSPVNEATLPRSARKCHWQAKPPRVSLRPWPPTGSWAIPKGIWARNTTPMPAVKCHSENTGHPQKPLNATCGRCHDKSLATPVLMGPIHFQMSFHENPLQFILRILYGLGFMVVDPRHHRLVRLPNLQKEKGSKARIRGGREAAPGIRVLSFSTIMTFRKRQKDTLLPLFFHSFSGELLTSPSQLYRILSKILSVRNKTSFR